MSQDLNVTLLVNPTAGRGKSARCYPEVVELLTHNGMACDVVLSQYPGHITRVTSDVAARGHDTVIVCGGDGTVNEAINGVAGTRTAIGIVPLGTANHLATDMGIGKGIDEACRIIQQRNVADIDLVRINDDKLFAGIGCLGFDAEVAGFVDSPNKKRSYPRLLRFIGNTLKFFSYHPKTVELRFDQSKFFGQVLLVAFADSSSWAHNVPTDSGGASDKPCLNVAVVTPMAKWRLACRFLSFSKEVNPYDKGVTIHQTHCMHVQSLGPMELYVNGDLMTTTPFRLELMPKHLRVIRNPNSSS